MVLLGTAAYVVAFEIAYRFLIVPNYGYEGYRSSPSSLLAQWIGWVLATIPSLWMPVAVSRPSQTVVWILYVLAYVPAVLVPGYVLDLETGRIIELSLALLIALTTLIAVTRLPRIRIPRLPLSSRSFWIIFGLGTAAAYVAIFLRFGFQFRLVSFLDVYDLRATYSEDLAINGRLIAYTVSWLGYVVNPFLVGYGLIERNWTTLGAGTVGQVLLYSLDGSKSVILSGLLLIALLVGLSNRRQSFGARISWGMAVMVTGTALYGLRTGNSLIPSLLIRRLIATPGLLTGYYFEFFSTHPKLLLSHSIFKWIFTYPYSLSPTHLIGYVYFGRAEMGANANLWADGFSNFGYFGLVMVSVVLGLALWLGDCVAGDQVLLASLLLGVPAFALSNSALLTTFLTHGLGLAILLLYVMPKAPQEFQEVVKK